MKITNLEFENRTVPVFNYTGVVVNLSEVKNFNFSDKPEYIPDLDINYYTSGKFWLWPVKLENDLFAIQFAERSWGDPSEEYICLVSLEVLVLTQHFYFNKVKQLLDEPREKIKRYPGLLFYSDGIRKFKKQNVTRWLNLQHDLAKSIHKDKSIINRMHKEMIDDFNNKLKDFEWYQKEDHDSYLKGEETSFGDVNVEMKYYESHGVGLKLQNGNDINDEHSKTILSALETFNAEVFNVTKWAKENQLKISFSQNRKMYARNSVGLFAPRYMTIGVSAKGNLSITLAHELGHFIDFCIGKEKGRYYGTDDYESQAGEIAANFRNSVSSKKLGDYHSRTKECFARAIEQYLSIKMELQILDKKGIYCPSDVFMKDISPKIEILMSSL